MTLPLVLPAIKPLYKWIGIGLLVVGILALSVIGVIKAVDGIYQRGFKAGELSIRATYSEKIMAAQSYALEQQKEIFAKTTALSALQAKYAELEASSPKEVIREVRKDPAFASARRPSDLHARRVRELQSLRSAAATH